MDSFVVKSPFSRPQSRIRSPTFTFVLITCEFSGRCRGLGLILIIESTRSRNGYMTLHLGTNYDYNSISYSLISQLLNQDLI